MTNYGIKITASGDDVSTAVDKNLILTSKHHLWKTALQGSTTLVIGGGETQSQVAQISHGLSYAPMFLVYAEAGSSKKFLAHANAYDTPSGYDIDRNIYSWSNTTNLNFWIHFGSPGSYLAYYYIFYDSL